VHHLSHSQKPSPTQGLYSPLSITQAFWEDVSLDFITDLPKTQKNKASIVVADQFFNATFIPCHTTFDATQVANLLFKEIVRLHGIPKSMILDKDRKFRSHFYEKRSALTSSSTYLATLKQMD